jgi:hypothetical protein
MKKHIRQLGKCTIDTGMARCGYTEPNGGASCSIHNLSFRDRYIREEYCDSCVAAFEEAKARLLGGIPI